MNQPTRTAGLICWEVLAMKRFALVLSTLAVITLVGCAKSPTAPTPDPYASMYGTWVGAMEFSDIATRTTGWLEDSVRVVVTPTGSTPTFHLWQGGIRTPWHEILFTPTTVGQWGDWDHSSPLLFVDAQCGADTISGLPDYTWHSYMEWVSYYADLIVAGTFPPDFRPGYMCAFKLYGPR